MIVESKEKEQVKQKESERELRKGIRRNLFKRSLVASGSLASIILGTYLIIYAVSSWAFGFRPFGVLSIMPVHVLRAGGWEDLALIVIGFALWGLGGIGLHESLITMKRRYYSAKQIELMR